METLTELAKEKNQYRKEKNSKRVNKPEQKNGLKDMDTRNNVFTYKQIKGGRKKINTITYN